jgi:hypothetical protein
MRTSQTDTRAEWNRLFAEARAPQGLRRSLALMLYDLGERLAPQVSRFNETKLTQFKGRTPQPPLGKSH